MTSTLEELRKIPEKFIIADLLKSSEFKEFYEKERGKIGPINWVQDPNLSEGIVARSTTLEIEAQYIRLRKIPVTTEDAGEIAHELQHLVLNNFEGFPATGVKDVNFENLSSALNSMIQDPIVDSRLLVYNLVDLGKKYEKDVDKALKILKKIPKAPSNDFTRTKWIFNYVGKMLDWELACSKGYKGKNKFRLYFYRYYKNIAVEGQKLLSLVKKIGYDTPKKQTRLFKEIIKRYNLENIIVL